MFFKDEGENREMEHISDQKILVYCKDHNKAIIRHGVRLAKIFKKELCLFSVYRNSEEKIKVKEYLQQLSVEVIHENQEVQCSWLFLKGKVVELTEKLANEYNVIILVGGKENSKQLLPALKNAEFPFLFVSEMDMSGGSYKKVFMPVDFRKECKQTGLWAGYFGRFNQAEVFLIEANEEGNYEEIALKSNIAFLFKLFRQFAIEYRTECSKKGSWGIQNAALKRAFEQRADLFIFLGSRNDSFIDQVIGTAENRILKKSEKMPVLCINPRRDMYVMCD